MNSYKGEKMVLSHCSKCGHGWFVPEGKWNSIRECECCDGAVYIPNHET